MTSYNIRPQHPLVSIGGIQNKSMLEEEIAFTNGSHLPTTIWHVFTAVYELIHDTCGQSVAMPATHEFISLTNAHLWEPQKMSFGKNTEKSVSVEQIEALKKMTVDLVIDISDEGKSHKPQARNFLFSIMGSQDSHTLVETALRDVKDEDYTDSRCPWMHPEFEFEHDLDEAIQQWLTLESACKLMCFSRWEGQGVWTYLLPLYKIWGGLQRKKLISVLTTVEDGWDFEKIHQCFETAFCPWFEESLPWSISLLSRLKPESIGEVFGRPRLKEKFDWRHTTARLDVALTTKVVRAFMKNGKQEKMKAVFEYWISNGQEEWVMRILRSLRNKSLAAELLEGRSNLLKI